MGLWTRSPFISPCSPSFLAINICLWMSRAQPWLLFGAAQNRLCSILPHPSPTNEGPVPAPGASPAVPGGTGLEQPQAPLDWAPALATSFNLAFFYLWKSAIRKGGF